MCLEQAHENLQRHPSSTSSCSSHHCSSLSSVSKIAHHSSNYTQELCENTYIDQNKSAFSSDSPAPKRKKLTFDPYMPKCSVKLPHFVTPVPCLGQIYKKQKSSESGSLHECIKSVMKASSGDSNVQMSEDEKELNHESQQQIQESHEEGALDPSGSGLTKDVLRIFLESVTDPDVVKHIGTVFCSKMKEAS